jgi:excisionase family DNA binding protein
MTTNIADTGGGDDGLDNVPAFVPVSKLSKKTNVPEETIRGWLRTGRLAYVKIGRRVLIPAGEIKRVILEGLHPAKTE